MPFHGSHGGSRALKDRAKLLEDVLVLPFLMLSTVWVGGELGVLQSLH